MSNDGRQEWLDQRTEVLRTSEDRDELETAAEQLAASDDPDALQQLAGFLTQSEFLKRLDDLSNPGEKTLHLSNVLRPLSDRPSPEVAELCLNLAEAPAFLEDDDRTAYLLEALAQVKPMSDRAVEFFHRTNDEGYFVSNAQRLVANGSPTALKLFASMMSDREVPWERRVDCLHASFVRHRTRLSTIEIAAELLTRDLEEPVALGVIESVFDFHWQWFGSRPPEPPAWRSAGINVLRRLIDLGEKSRRPNLPAQLQEAIDGTLAIARALLSRRKAA